MILDSLQNLRQYVALHPLFQVVSDYIETHHLVDLPVGRYTIRENELYLIIEEVGGKEKADAVLESHQEMIDLQIPLQVAETFGYTPTHQLPICEYSKEKDICFYSGEQPLNYVVATTDMFLIFFPQDAHAPCIANSERMKKAIFKVKASR
ncbi:MAG: YhcH/YjgK/YiaL family protein [Prevotella sp.]|nr:YhcH/YjgK/YiaL family protein [Prevotella sp.]